jgi:hypothetical protein
LEKLWIGTSEGKVSRTIQYPVTSRWAKELDKTSGVNEVLYLHDASMQWTQWRLMEFRDATEGLQGCTSPLHQGICVVVLPRSNDSQCELVTWFQLPPPSSHLGDRRQFFPANENDSICKLLTIVLVFIKDVEDMFLFNKDSIYND